MKLYFLLHHIWNAYDDYVPCLDNLLPPHPQPYNTAKRDFLIKIQKASQAKWEAAKVFEVDAPNDGKFLMESPG